MKVTAILIAAAGIAAFAASAREGGPLERLKAADTNGDGMISRAEAAALPRIAKHFDAIDANRDGQLTFDEIRAYHEARRGEHWMKLDTNGDGLVSRAEAQAGAPRLAEHFDQLDTNKDGQLSKDEIKAGQGFKGRK